MSKGIECPHCHEDISRQFAVKSLAMLAKSEGAELSEELEALAGEDEEIEGDEPEVEKGMSKKVGNKMDSHRGPHKAGKMHSSSRGKGTGETVQKKPKPGNMVTEKSLRLPVQVGQPQLVEYTSGGDAFVAKGIQDGTHHVPPARNLRKEREEAEIAEQAAE